MHRDLHFWLGNSTSQDEAGSAASLSVMLDHILYGGAVHHREVQYEESPLFKSYFRGGKFQYLPGGVKSGMNYVADEQILKRLFMVKGRETVIASQVPYSITSLNMFDCFVLDRGKGRGVFVFRPRGANSFERFKATLFATDIRDEDHAGKGSVEIFDEAENDNMSRFFEELGGGSLADIFSPEIDDKNNDFVPKLYETRGWQDIYIDEPLSQDLLDSNKTYMLVAGPKTIYLWLGRFTTKIMRRTVNEVAGLFMKDNEMPSNTTIEQVFEGLEAASFKQFFPSWKEIINTESWNSYLPENTFSGPHKVVDKPDFEVNNMHQRTEDWLERNVNGIIG